MVSTSLTFTLVLFVTTITTSWGIRCYICTSVEPDSEFAKPGDKGMEKCGPELNRTTTTLKVQDCGGEHTHCVKMTTAGEGVSTVVSRFCGTADFADQCWTGDGNPGDTEQCYCSDEDGCNAGSVTSPTFLLVSALSMLGALLVHLRK